LGKPPISRDFSAKYRQHRRALRFSVAAQRVVARYRGWIARAIVVERSHPRVMPEHLLRARRLGKVAIRRAAQVIDLFLRGARVRGLIDYDIRSADQRE